MFAGQFGEAGLHALQGRRRQVQEGLVRLSDLLGLGLFLGLVLGGRVLELLNEAQGFLELLQAALELPPAFQSVAVAELRA